MSKPLISSERALRELTGRWGDIEQFSQIEEGEESRAFSFRHAGQDYVLRINRSAEGYGKDGLACRMFGSADLPIPQVVLIDRLADGDAFCISRRAKGETLQALRGTRLAEAVVSVAHLLDMMATADVSAISGYGRFGTDGLATHSSWRDWIGDIPIRSGIEGAPAWAAKVRMLAHALPELRQLVHGDFGSNNVLIEGGAVSGVIDWSEAMVGDGLYDVANILFWRTWLDCMEQQARYFENQQPARLADSQRLLCYQLRIGLQLLDEAVRNDDAAMVRWIGARCAEIAAS